MEIGKNRWFNKNFFWAAFLIIETVWTVPTSINPTFYWIALIVIYLSFYSEKELCLNTQNFVRGLLILNIFIASYFDPNFIRLISYWAVGFFLAKSATINRYYRIFKKVSEKEFPSLKSS